MPCFSMSWGGDRQKCLVYLSGERQGCDGQTTIVACKCVGDRFRVVTCWAEVRAAGRALGVSAEELSTGRLR
jgi:hypothetical protein